MHLHILGICGTFMGGIARIARQLGHRVTGSDQGVYPPMSEQLQAMGIELIEGYAPTQLEPEPDLVIIGNGLSRGNPAVEYILARNIPFISAPDWLYRQVLKDRWVVAVSGTHGKTTTTAMVAWLLQQAGFDPGFLIGGVANTFPFSAELGQSPFFVIEADEYDTAFFDKRPKFIHYHPKTLIINNLEFDHGDIYADFPAIQQQFHYLIRTVPPTGLIIHPAAEMGVQQVLDKGCWSEATSFAKDRGQWQLQIKDSQSFIITKDGKTQAAIAWSMLGEHNMLNGMAAFIAAQHCGLALAEIEKGLNSFAGVKRRLEIRGTVNENTIYDDFAHHPTAIAATLNSLRSKVGNSRIIAVLELASNTMKLGHHVDELPKALVKADEVYYTALNPSWDPEQLREKIPVPAYYATGPEEILQALKEQLRPGDQVLIMSNKGFANIHQRLLELLPTS